MGEEFQTGICGGNFWWNNMNSTRSSVFPLMISSTPCSMAANNDAGGIGYTTWQTDTVDLKPTTTTTTSSCADHQDSNTITNDSSLGLPVMGFGLSSNWNHSLLGRCSGKPAESNNFNTCMLQEGSGIDSSSPNSTITQKDWRPLKSFSSISSSSSCSTMNDGFKQDLYGYPSNSTLIQSLYDLHHHNHIPQPQDSLFTNPSMAYSSTPNYGVSSNEAISPTSWSKLGLLHFSNNNNTTPFWNIASPQPEALHDMRVGVFAPSSSSSSSQPQQQYQTSTPNFPTALIAKPKSEEALAEPASTVKKSVGEPAMKKQRIETPSPLPTFKVRKEKLGDRITALQQLVSPFGKTDTASVLHEAIEYIRFLHDQVSVLSTPYLKNGAPIQHHQQGCEIDDSEGPKQDLRSRGLCLVPISSTFPVTNETTADFWTPSFGGALIR